ncbi:DUF3618 domain-containing protein [Streptomyces sp. NPDC002564]|uniref:DUF3618 domain-containing protein n=1 Tax=Streptomyces sp. NPDC002564 TaxID=3364649 RepID=UPI0036964184
MTNSPKDAKDAKDPGLQGSDELRKQIEETRGDLGETVQELAAKADVKARAKHRADVVKGQVRGTAAQVKDKVTEQAARARGKATDEAGHARSATADGAARAKDKAAEGAGRAKDKAIEGAARAKDLAAEGAGRAKGAVLSGKARAEEHQAVVQAEEKVAEVARRVQDGTPEPVRNAASGVVRTGGRHPKTFLAAGAGLLLAVAALRRRKRAGRR